MSAALVEVSGLSKFFPVRRGLLQSETAEFRAVDAVDLEILKGETLALVGESGSGKTTFARCLLRLLEATSGSVVIDGEDLMAMSAHRLRQRRRNFQMVFQDPYGSLNPRMRIGEALAEPLAIHDVVPRPSRAKRVEELLELVGLPGEVAARFPHEFSGGQRQRIAIARALAPEPGFLVADEPVAALDVSVRAQILNVLSRLQEHLGLTLLLIAHDLAIVEQMADRVAILFLGRLVELAPSTALFANPLHPYTVNLLSCVPTPDPLVGLPAAVASEQASQAIEMVPGCGFYSRCPVAKDHCRTQRPDLLEIQTGHEVACHYPGELERGRPTSAGNGTF